MIEIIWAETGHKIDLKSNNKGTKDIEDMVTSMIADNEKLIVAADVSIKNNVATWATPSESRNINIPRH